MRPAACLALLLVGCGGITYARDQGAKEAGTTRDASSPTEARINWEASAGKWDVSASPDKASIKDVSYPVPDKTGIKYDKARDVSYPIPDKAGIKYDKAGIKWDVSCPPDKAKYPDKPGYKKDA